ncbi:MAG: type II toxin-antitoxin system Phd/YefM family antitoxin [Oscillospiraceae bacterium]|nr:type II toxin-antitoxin system Phd/YefM family antitoxin [Oscillospiraceae bacterium]
MYIKPSAAIRKNYNEIAALCKQTGEPVYLTKNGSGDLVVMDVEAFAHREYMLDLRESLLRAEENRMAGEPGYTPEEAMESMQKVIAEVSRAKTLRAAALRGREAPL